MRTYKSVLAEHASRVLQVPETDVLALIEYPPNRELGDLALPCFRFARTLRRSPQEIAAELASALQSVDAFASATQAGGYVNVHFSRSQAAQAVVDQVQQDVDGFLSSRRLAGHRVAIDYSSPNIAKPFGVGHLRSTMIGQAIVRLLEADGSETVGINHLGDWGTQFGKNIVAYLKWGDEEVVRQDPVRELLGLYVRFHEEAKADPSLDDEAREWFKKLEDGDERAVQLWQWFITESRKVFDETYRLLGVSFDYYLGESFYNDKMQAVVDELRDKGLLTHSEGAEVVDLSEWNMPPCIIVKSDGATIYATRDLAAALYRHDELGADRLIYVVGSEQTLHFQQLFKVLERMGRPWAGDCRHVAFGMMKYNGERLSTRRGKVIYLEDVLQQAIQEAKSIIEAKNPNLADKDAVAKAVGVGAVVFNDLKNDRMHEVDFRFEDVLNFDGETGPYVQYTHARACSVLRKAGLKDDGKLTVDAYTQVDDLTWNLVHHLAQANEVFERAVDDLDPSQLARYVLDLCHHFNRFYHDVPILSAAAQLRQERLALTNACRMLIKKVLFLLGLEAPERM